MGVSFAHCAFSLRRGLLVAVVDVASEAIKVRIAVAIMHVRSSVINIIIGVASQS
jgi:hypothetical protein